MDWHMPNVVRRFVAIWLAWTAAGLFYVTQDFIGRLYRGESVPWLSVIVGWMVGMYICAAFTPAILWLGRRWALERGHLLGRVFLHLCFAALFSVVSAAIEAPILKAIGGFPRIEQANSLGAAVLLLTVYGLHGGIIRYWAVLGLQAVFRSHQNAKEREREALELTVRSTRLAQQLTAAQLGALKMQLQPHFLFNTLGAIMVLTQQNRGPQARTMLARLSDLLRLTLEDVDAQEVPLHRELEFLRLYLSIEQVRFEDRLRVQITANPNVSDALVPHMVLQPIVENAVRHGLGQSEDAVLIDIRAHKVDDTLVMTVSDDGHGSPSPRFEGTGIGLANTRNRLRHLYGMDATLVAENRSPRGVQVTMTLPFHLEFSENVDAIESSYRR
jgi:two-component system, LytTR family, sensor kinase